MKILCRRIVIDEIQLSCEECDFYELRMSLCLWKIWNCYIDTFSFRRQVVTRRKVLLDEMKWIIQRCEGLVKIISENNEGFSSFAVHCRCLSVELDIQSKCRSKIHREQWRMHFCSKIIWEFREKQQVRIIIES